MAILPPPVTIFSEYNIFSLTYNTHESVLYQVRPSIYQGQSCLLVTDNSSLGPQQEIFHITYHQILFNYRYGD